MYRYLAKNFSVYDGDTVRCDIDLGFGVWLSNQTLRLYGINTPEVRGPEREAGLLAKKWLSDRVLGKELWIVTHKDQKGKYGRWLATIYDDGKNLNLELIREGYAVPYG